MRWLVIARKSNNVKWTIQWFIAPAVEVWYKSQPCHVSPTIRVPAGAGGQSVLKELEAVLEWDHQILPEFPQDRISLCFISSLKQAILSCWDLCSLSLLPWSTLVMMVGIYQDDDAWASAEMGVVGASSLGVGFSSGRKKIWKLNKEISTYFLLLHFLEVLNLDF